VKIKRLESDRFVWPKEEAVADQRLGGPAAGRLRYARLSST
jgi:hypothetical protein